MEIPFEPAKPYFLVKKVPQDNYIKSVSGLLVPTAGEDTFSERVELLRAYPQFGTVVPGQIVYVMKGAPAPIKVKGIEYFLIKEENILGIEG